MLVFESHRLRHLLVRLERGEDLLAALRQLAERESITAAWVRGVGALEDVRLRELDQSGKRFHGSRRIGSCELLSLEGTLSLEGGAPSVELHASVSRETDVGLQVLGGRLESARAFSCELALTCFGDLQLERKPDPLTGLSLWQGHSRGVTQTTQEDAAPTSDRAASSGGVSWAQVAAASETPKEASIPVEEIDLAPGRKKLRSRKMPAFLDDPDIVAGDWIDHRQFGICRVEKVDDEGGLLIKLPTSRRKRIKVDIFEITGPRQDVKGRRIFTLRPRTGR